MVDSDDSDGETMQLDPPQLPANGQSASNHMGSPMGKEEDHGKQSARERTFAFPDTVSSDVYRLMAEANLSTVFDVSEYELQLKQQASHIIGQRKHEIDAYNDTLSQALGEVRRVRVEEEQRLGSDVLQAQESFSMHLALLQQQFKDKVQELEMETLSYLRWRREECEAAIAQRVVLVSRGLMEAGGTSGRPLPQPHFVPAHPSQPPSSHPAASRAQRGVGFFSSRPGSPMLAGPSKVLFQDHPSSPYSNQEYAPSDFRRVGGTPSSTPRAGRVPSTSRFHETHPPHLSMASSPRGLATPRLEIGAPSSPLPFNLNSPGIGPEPGSSYFGRGRSVDMRRRSAAVLGIDDSILRTPNGLHKARPRVLDLLLDGDDDE